ncbi:MAG: hypothetical protein QOH83_1599 [Solirubrobacteraceae bacterium]|nr:hypothetical protein [Solirubrobacteraceae bacterium]
MCVDLDGLVERLHEKSVQLFLEDGKLCVRAPRGTIDPDLQEALARHRLELRDLVGRRLGVKGAAPPRDRGSRAPLSFGQLRLWFLDTLDAGAAYDMPAVLRVRGELDVELVERSLNAIVARHEALRTTFTAVDGRPSQVVAKRVVVRVAAHDLTGVDPAQRERTCEEIVQREARHRFDLAAGPLLRAAVVRLGSGDHVVVLNLHHIVADAWSMRIFIHEIGACYAAFSSGRPADLPPLAIQYADYAIDERERLSDDLLAADIDFWRDTLDGAPEELALPFDRPHPAQRRHRGDVVRTHLAAQLRDRLAAYAAERDATLFQVLLAAYATLLHRYSGQADLVVGVPLANRGRPEVGPLIGFFVNTLPVRIRFDGDPSFEALTDHVRTQVLSGLKHLDAPFERIVDALQPQRSLQHAPLFQTMFCSQEAPTSGLAMLDPNIEILPVHNGTAKFDLTVLLEERDDGIDAPWEFDSDVFDAATVVRMSESYEVLLEAICADPTRPVSQLELLSDAERHKVLFDTNATARAFPREQLVDELFAAQAGRSAGRIAVKHGDATLTYAELAERSDALARVLHGAGAARGRRVGLCCDPGLELVVGLVAIAKAGGCCVPIAPGDPEARQAFIVTDAACAAIVAQPSYHDALRRAVPGTRLVSPRDVAATTQDAPDAAGPRDPEDALCVMYTSGSTGTPNGVVVPHRAVTRLVYGQDYLDFESGKTFAQWNSPSFDAFTFEAWGALLHGGRLVCIATETLLDPVSLARQVRDEEIEAGFMTTPLFHQVAQVEPAAFATMDTLLVGGEVLQPRWIAEVLRHGPPRRLLNVYGPTECTTFATAHEIAAVGDGERSIPIGRPLSNTSLYVLDEHGEPQPIGVRGELCIGGPGVALGYLDRPQLTAGRFVPDPFGGGTMYRTGDRASLRADGAVLFHGRLDGQAKIRGHRVEIGEVEHALAALPEVARAAVVAHRLQAGHLQLVAYVVPAGSAGDLARTLAERLRDVLPDYMVPARWMVLESLPSTSSGKLDRRALPLPPGADEQGEPSDLDGDPRAPGAGERGGPSDLDGDPRAPGAGERGEPDVEAEAVLAEIWREVLGVPAVHRDDNFFALGGDSILSIQVAARAEQRGLHVTARKVFATASLAELAASAGEERVAAEQGLVEGEVPLTPIQRWFLGLGMAAPERFTQSVLLELRPDVDAEALTRTVAELPARHDALRLRYQLREGRPPVQWHGEVEGAATLERFDLAGLTARRRAQAIATRGAALKASLDLTHGPLLRGALFTTGQKTPARLLLAAHHLVVDAVSWRILITDLVAVYGDVARGLPVPPARKTTSFKAWAQRLAAAAEEPELRAEAERWCELAGGPADPRAATPGAATAPAASARVAFDRRETERLLDAPHGAYGMGIHEVLLAALASCPTLAQGAGGVLVDIEGHGREDLFEDVDHSRTVGWFTTVFPVRLVVDPAAGPRDALLSVKERLRRVPAGGIGWGLLHARADAEPAQRLAAVPAAAVGFNYLGRIDSAAGGGVVLGLGSEPTGADWPDDAPAFHPLEVEAQVLDGALCIDITGRSPAFDAPALQRIAAELHASVDAFVSHFDATETAVYSPSDFPDVDLAQDELDALVAQLGDAGLEI